MWKSAEKIRSAVPSTKTAYGIKVYPMLQVCDGHAAKDLQRIQPCSQHSEVPFRTGNNSLSQLNSGKRRTVGNFLFPVPDKLERRLLLKGQVLRLMREEY
jgi:hypothetical protein